MKKTFLILLLLLVGLSVSAKRYYDSDSPKHGAIDKNIDAFNKIADILSSRYSFDFNDADSAKMFKGFSFIVDPIYVAGTKEIEKVLILAHPFVGGTAMKYCSRRVYDKRTPVPVLAKRDSLYYYFTGTVPDFFATLGDNNINKFIKGYDSLELKIVEKRVAQERIRIMALPADNEERVKLEKKDKRYKEMIERSNRGEVVLYGVIDERHDCIARIYGKMYRDYDFFILLPKRDPEFAPKAKIIGWFVN